MTTEPETQAAPTLAEPPVTPDPVPETPAQVTMSQQDLDKLIAARVDKVRKTTETETATRLLGDRTAEEVAALLEAHDAQQAAAMTEAERLQAEAETVMAAAAADRAEAAGLKRTAMVDAALVAAGANQLDLVRKLVDIDTDYTIETVAEAVEAVKAQVPALFGNPTAPGTPPAPSTTTANGAPPAPTADTGVSRLKAGREKFRSHHHIPNAAVAVSGDA